MISRFGLFLIAVLVLFSCKDAANTTENASVQNKNIELAVPETNHPDFVSKMEVAHNKTALLNNGLICFNLEMSFRGRKSSMKIFTTPNSSAIRVDKHDGPSTVMINGEIYTDADSTAWNSEKFGIYTYQYFFMAPYKFSDEGTIWTKLPDRIIEGINTNLAKLTFEAGTGDAPDDWYMVHSDPKTNLVSHIGYIVTGGGRSVEVAEKSAHAIKYSEYEKVDGVPFANKWEFFKYDKEAGLGEMIGNGTIKNIEMMDNVDQFDIINDGTFVKIN